MQQICSCCNQVIRKLNPHRMDRHKVTTLEMMGKAAMQGDPWVRDQAGSGMLVGGVMLRAPYRVQAHVSRLVWFGLADHGAHRSGEYMITPEGLGFLRGIVSVPSVIHCKDGKVVKESDTRVWVSQVKNVVLDKKYWDDYWKEQV